MVVELIPHTLKVSEQFVKKKQLMDGIGRWADWRFNTLLDGEYYAFVYTDSVLKILEEECGIRCSHIKGIDSLTGFKMVDEKKYLMFILRWL